MCACGAGGMSVARCFERVGGDHLYVPGEHVALAGLRGAGVRVRGGWRHSMAPSMDHACLSLPHATPPRRAPQAVRLVHPLPCVYVRRALGAPGHTPEPLPRSEWECALCRLCE